MLLQQLNRNDAEKVFIIVKNLEGATMPKDSAAQMLIDTTMDGNRACQPNTGELDFFLGIVDAAIVSLDFGLVQIYGYRATSKVFQTDTSRAAGSKMVPVAGADYIIYAAAGDGRDGFLALGEDVATSATSATISKKIFIRAM
jgi:hypothetical protein